MIYLLGTSHISSASVAQIKKEGGSLKYSVVAVELDPIRLKSMFSKESGSLSPRLIFQVGVVGYLFAVLGRYVQQKLGRVVGVMPGEEMKTAVVLSAKNKLKLALIDRRIDKTLRAFSTEFSFMDKMRMVYDFFYAILFQKKYLEKVGFKSFDLTSVPSSEVVKLMVGHLENRYPSLYKVLIHDRNKVMVNGLVRLSRKEENEGVDMLAVVGAGHVPGMVELLEKKKVEFVVI